MCIRDRSYTLTSADRHAVFSRQRSDEFLQNRVTATQSARQHKDATDLVCEPYQNTVGTIGGKGQACKRWTCYFRNNESSKTCLLYTSGYVPYR